MPEVALKKGWTRVAFGDVVKLRGERSSNPDEDGFERFVGLEHIDPGDLKIRRWGDIADGTTFTSVFRPGHVLFGKRRAYQRKVAVADFSGVCSGDIYVLEPKNAHLLPELLPFICQTDGYFEHAIGTSAGSLSPRTNWDSLASYGFALPPLEEQRRIAHTLRAAIDLGDAYRVTLGMLEQVIRRVASAEFERAMRTATPVRLKHVADLKMGRQKAPKYAKGLSPRPFLRVVNVGELELMLDDIETMDFTDVELARFRLSPGDILITEGDLISKFNVGRPAMFNGEITDCCFQNTLIRLRPLTGLDPHYCLLILEGARLSGVFARAAKTTTVTHLSLGRLSEVELPIPSWPEQQVAGSRLVQLLESRTSIRKRVGDAAQIVSVLSERVFA